MVKNIFSKKTFPKNLLLLFLISFSLIQSVNSACNASNCPPLRGLCQKNMCVCEEGFTTINNENIKNNGIFCNYILKSRYVAFLLEFLFPIGVGHFYSGKTILASIKLGIFVLLVFSCIFMLCCLSKNRHEINMGKYILVIIIVLSFLSLILMEIFDLIAYGIGLYNDGNGVQMN